MSEEEYNEQLSSAMQFIIDSAEESKNFKEAAETYSELNENTITQINEALKQAPAAYVPEDEKNAVYKNAKRGALDGVREAISKTSVKIPSKEYFVPVLRDALNEIGPEITYKRVIEGKKLFWMAILLFALCGTLAVFYIKDKYSFDGTAESWANRMYVVNKEMLLENPGSGYDEIMTDFANGNTEMAKEKVIRAEQSLSELKDHRGKYEKKISGFLSTDCPSGVRIVDLEENVGERNIGGVFNITQRFEFVYARAVSMDEHAEYRIAMERPLGNIISQNLWDIYITTDTRINSIADYRQKASKVHWEYSKKKAFK